MTTRDNDAGPTGRIERQKWIEENNPNVKWAFHNATIFRLFMEAQGCYVSGYYLASILAGVSFLEQSLAAEFHSRGIDEFRRASLPELAETARSFGCIWEPDLIEIKRIWGLRKPITHSRSAGHPDRIESRQFAETCPIDAILERDSRGVLTTLFHLTVNRLGFGIWSGQIPKNYGTRLVAVANARI